MLETVSKQSLAASARTVAQSYHLVMHNNHLYVPVHWETEEPGLFPPDQQIWQLLSRKELRRLGNDVGVLFSNDSELTNFILMVEQFSDEHEEPITQLLMRTPDGLRSLQPDGTFGLPPGSFMPNTLTPTLNTDEADKQFIFDVVKGWLNSEEEAISLLRHLSTALSPGWSAVKYILLLGDGRNGKSLLLKMMEDMFGKKNISNVTRQQMAARLPVCNELSNKLLNIVFDGEMTYVRDSSVEKTLTAGEPAVVRMLFENGNTVVSTNALFIEGLNLEPKTRDKSGALQKRLARFWFPNVYKLDYEFEEKLRGPRMAGAFLALLLDNFVPRSQLATKLAQTAAAKQLQVEQMLLNSPIQQFLAHLVFNDPKTADKLMGTPVMMDSMVTSFMAWRVGEGHSELNTTDVKKMFKQAFFTDWKAARENGKTVNRQRLIEPKQDTLALLEYLKGVPTDETADEPVVDG